MEEVRLEWTVRLYQNWRKTAILVLVIILICALVYLSFHEILFVILAAIFLCGSVINFFFPIKYVFTDESIKVITPLTSKKRNWSTLKSYYIDKNGIFLSPFAGKSRLERFRGLYLIGARHNTEAIAFVREKLKPQKETKA
ncbi:hypothetical protein ACFL5I_01265 [Planctomycetota bacterium]